MQIGFIGVGNMGEAILRGALRGGLVLPSQVSAYDPNTAKLNLLSGGCGTIDYGFGYHPIGRKTQRLRFGSFNACRTPDREGAHLHCGRLVAAAAGKPFAGLRSRFASHAEYAGFGRVRDVGI